MTEIQIASVDAPLSRQALRSPAFGLVLRAIAVGLLPEHGRIERLDIGLLREIARAAAAAGVGRDAALGLLDENVSPARLATLIGRLDEALANSPVPDRELRQLRNTMELDQLAQLLGTSEVSLRRYLAGSRTVPDPIAARAHWLALLVSDLYGAYNKVGIRRWFERPRPQLNGRSPSAVLVKGWDPDDPAIQAVRELGQALSSSAAT